MIKIGFCEICGEKNSYGDHISCIQREEEKEIELKVGGYYWMSGYSIVDFEGNIRDRRIVMSEDLAELIRTRKRWYASG